ncbi:MULTISPECIES: outer membrane beta-barrel protein [unclassified Carboxylicivirga]|uniref:outer membrane beta-barrel protein n=1 Tax=Carboxylicivirga TaxID=1628153 RepID=UPI003D330913
MKKIKIFLLLACVTSCLYGQQNELKVQYSPIPLSRIDSGGGIYMGDTKSSDTSHSGNFGVEYNRYLNDWFKLGVSFNYETHKVKNLNETNYTPQWPNNDNTITERTNDLAKYQWFFVGPQAGVDYLRRDKFRLGSLVGVSLMYEHSEYEGSLNGEANEVDFFFHVEVLNFTLGKKHGLSGQAGFGHKGIVSLGYFFRW